MNKIKQVILLKKLWMALGVLCLALSFIIVEVVQANKTSGVIIYIDPGHGGSDGGAIGADGTYEKDIVLPISLALEELFVSDGYDVIMTRREDIDLAPSGSHNRKRDDIHKRVELINNSGAELYLSIHANIFPNSYCWGAQTFFKRNESKSRELAVNVQNSLLLNLMNTYRVAKHINDVYIVDNVIIPGCLVEVGFLSNREELELLKSNNYQKEVAMAIFLGVKEYLEKYQK